MRQGALALVTAGPARGDVLASPPVRLRAILFVLFTAALEATAAAAPFAYVLAQRDDDPGPGSAGGQTLVVIDTATNSIATTIPLGRGCLYCFRASTLAVAPDGSRVFVANQVAGTVSIVDVATHTVAATVPVGGAPNGVVPSPDGTRLYVLRGSSIAVVDLGTLAVSATLTLPTFAATGGMVITADGTRLYVGDFGGTRLAVVDTTTGSVRLIPLPDRPIDLEITPDGSEVYVAAGGTHQVFVVDTATATVGPAIVVGTTDHYPNSVRLTVNAAHVYVANLRGNTLSVINRSTHTVVGTVPRIFNPRTLDFTTDGSRALVTTLATVSIVDVATGTFAGSIPISPDLGEPTAVVVADPPPAPPAAPAGLTVWSVAGDTVTLRWSSPAFGPAPTAHVVEGGVNPGEVLASLRTGSASPIFTLRAPSGAFYVRVRALNGPTVGPASNQIRIFVNVPQPPSAPVGFTGAVSGRSVALTWRTSYEGGAPTGVALDVSGSIVATLPLGLAESVAFDDVPAGTYTLALRAVNAAGASVPSNAVTLTIPGACSGVPAPPSDFLAYRDGRRLTVLWNPAPAGPATQGYVLAVSGPLSAAVSTAERTLSGLVGPGTYSLTVAGTNACGQGAPTTAQVVIVP